jgi:hypothetical protein
MCYTQTTMVIQFEGILKKKIILYCSVSCNFRSCHGRDLMVVGLPNNSYKSIANTAWVHARLCKLQKIAGR